MTTKQILEWIEDNAEVVYRIPPSSRDATVLWRQLRINWPYRSLKEAVEKQTNHRKGR